MVLINIKVFFASMHKVAMDTGIFGMASWSLKDYIFGLIDMDNQPHPAACILFYKYFTQFYLK